MKRGIVVLLALLTLMGGALLDRWIQPAPVSAQGQFVIQQATGACTTDASKFNLYPGLLCLVLDTSTLYMFDGQPVAGAPGSWRQFVLLPAGATSLTIAAGTSITTPTLSGATLVTGLLTITGAGLAVTGGYISTAPGIPIAFPGDFVVSCGSLAPTTGPGFGALTLRGRRSKSFPGASSLWAVAGSASTEILIRDNIPGNC